MQGSHDHFLVALSILVAAVASYTALDLAGRVKATGKARAAWLAAAAIAMGGGIWSMHFIAMLAFSMPMPVSYDIGLTVASLALAVAVTGAGFAATAYRGTGLLSVLLSGILMGCGIAGMHYMGMAAMRMDADLSYDALLVALSILIAIGASCVALFVAFRSAGQVNRVLAAAAMGLAISGMHYTAMVGSIFTSRSAVDHAHGSAGIGQTQLALAVAAATLLILLIALVGAMFDRRVGEYAEREAAALRASEEQFRQLHREAPVPLHALDDKGALVQVSDAWLELLGYERGEVLGRSLTAFLSDASKPAWSQAHAVPARDRQQGEYQFRTKGGALLDVWLDERRIRAADGRVLELGGLADLTSRRRAEAELRQAQKLESIGQLTGGLAHDFNNLLNVVLGNVELLAKRVPPEPHTTRLVEGIEQAARRGAALTQRMLAFARKQDLKPEAIDLQELVHGMSELLTRTLGPEVQVTTSFPLVLPEVLVDRNQLELALLNLAVNARDAMPGGGTIAIAATAEPAGEDRSAFVRLSLEDTGEGMDAEVLARATDPFFTTKGIGKGTGLGLSMVQGLATQSGGRFRLESAKGKGTTALLWLPVAHRRPASPVESEPQGSDEALAADGLVVLAVDDDPLVLMGTAAMVEDLGFKVIEANSAAEALQHLRAGVKVDLLVTDYAMPKKNGVELAREAVAVWPDLPIVLASGYAELKDADQLKLVRLSKPFTQASLRRALMDARGQRDARRDRV